MAGAGVVTTVITTPDPTRVLSVFAGSLDVTGDVLWSSFQVTDSGTNAKGTASFRVERTPSAVAEIRDQSLVRVYDHTANGGEVFRGYVRARRPSEDPAYSYLDVIADDLTSLLDDVVIDVEWRPPETLQARIGFLWGRYAGFHLSGDLQYVLNVGGTLPAQRFALVSLRNAIEMVIAQASSTADYYVDMLGKLHIFTSETNNAPKNIDADAPDGTEIAPEELDLEYDSNSYANRVYISGASPTASGYFQDDAAIAAASGLVRTAVVQAPDCTTATMAQSLALMYLGRVKTAKPRGTFSTTSAKVDGWRAGQNVLVTSAAHGLSAQSYRIARVTTKVIRPGASLQRRYTVEFGGARAGAGIDGVAPLIAGGTAGVYMLDQLGNAIVSNAAAANSGGLGPALRRYVLSGVYNGDFYAPPPGPDAPVDNTTNPLPYWGFTAFSGTAITAISTLDSLNASGRKLVFNMIAGAASDDAYIEQVIPVNGSQALGYTYAVAGTWKTTSAVNSMVTYVGAQFLKNDGVTTTGTYAETTATTTSIGASTVADKETSPGAPNTTPADAYFLRVRIGFKRGAEAAGSSGQVELHEVHITAGTLTQRIAAQTASLGPAVFYHDNAAGVLNIAENVGGTGSSPTIALEGNTATPTVNLAKLVNTKVEFTPQGAIATRSATQAITTATYTAVSYNSTDISDPFGFHDPASNASRFTVPTGWDGTYLLIGHQQFASTTSPVQCGWSKNGAGAAAPNAQDETRDNGTNNDVRRFAATTIMELAAGDYVEFMIRQQSGGNLNYEANGWAAIYYIGEAV